MQKRPLNLFFTILFTVLLAACSDSPKYQPLAQGTVVLAFGDSVTHGTGAQRGEDSPSREMGMMRLLLTAPLPRTYLLACKLVAGTFLSVLQAMAFFLLAVLCGVDLNPIQVMMAVPVVVLGALMLSALGLVLSVHIRQLENFAGTMNFVIFPMFFLSSALYPLWKVRESGAEWIYLIASFNPFTHAVEALRFALYGQVNLTALIVVAVCTVVFYGIAVLGFDPQRGLIKSVRHA